VLEAPPDSLDKDLRNKLELQLLEFLEKVCSNGAFGQESARQPASAQMAQRA